MNLGELRKMYVKDIVEHCGMKSNPAKYSGKIANKKDLSESRLECIFDEVENNLGHEAANNFIQLIEYLPNLAPAPFLKSLYNLEKNNWIWEEKLWEDYLNIDNHKQLLRTMTNIVISFLNKKDLSEDIREQFLLRVKH